MLQVFLIKCLSLNSNENINGVESDIEPKNFDENITQFLPLNWKNVWDYFYKMVFINYKFKFLQLLEDFFYSIESLKFLWGYIRRK